MNTASASGAPAPGLPARRVVLIDNYDSFSFNLVDYLRRLGCQVVTYRNTVPADYLLAERPDLVVVSPGPYTPRECGNLMGILEAIHRQVPLFGVCLGHEAIIELFGGTLRTLDRPYHGKQSLVAHNGQGIFAGLPSPFEAGRYHSLVGDTIPPCLEVTARTGDVPMAVQHVDLPIVGVQFHPESILTMRGDHGFRLMANVVQRGLWPPQKG